MILFYFKFFLTNVVFSLVIWGALERYNHGEPGGRKLPLPELLLAAFGLGPAVTVLLLYFLFLSVPGLGNFFYLAVVFLVYLLLIVWGRQSFALLPAAFKQYVQAAAKRFRGLTALRKTERILYVLLLAAVLTVFLYFFLGNTLQTPLEGHDVLVYGNLGKVYYHQKAITYSKNIYDKTNGFYFSGSPKPAFSLLLTWEMMVNRVFGTGQTAGGGDLYFKSISAYYGLLILFLAFYHLHRLNRCLALLGILALLSGLRFFLLLVNFHLDSYRIFFLLFSWIFLAYTIQRKDRFFLFLFAVFSGLAAFTHVIGVAVAIVNGLALLIFLDTPIKDRLWKTLTWGTLVLLFGGVHYLLEALAGAQWGFLTYF